jgi:preflagellin peptidase FlaK
LNQFLESLRITVCLGFLIYASWSDYKTREVSNNVWIIFGPIALILTSIQILYFPPISIGGSVLQAFLYYGLSFTISSIFAVILFYVGAYGGADAKAIMCIALSIPFPPELVNPLSGFVSLVFPITVFSNGVIIAVLSVFYALGRNLLWKLRGKKFFEGYKGVSVGHRILTLLCGYKVSIKKLKESFLYPLEDICVNPEGEKSRCLLLFPKDDQRSDIIDRVASAAQEDEIREFVWATPGLPMLIFITLGFIASLVVGDFVWLVVNQVMQ